MPGVEPTNNVAERPSRPAVLWRRKSVGTHSVAGSRFAARMLERRGFCPSCGGRRKAERAASLVDRVLPRVPVR